MPEILAPYFLAQDGERNEEIGVSQLVLIQHGTTAALCLRLSCQYETFLSQRRTQQSSSMLKEGWTDGHI